MQHTVCMASIDTASLVDAISGYVRRAPTTTVRIVGVDGPSGSGKSTLAAPLAARLDAPLIEIDHFVSWADFAGWWPRFDEQVLDPLFDGRDAMYQRRDWVNDEFGRDLAEWKRVPWSPIVVIEGVTSTRTAVSERLACRVWVEAPADERLRRGVARDGESHRALWERWMRDESRFFEEDRTRTRADFVVSGRTGCWVSGRAPAARPGR
jgi:uridine kinase